jgi:GT2 family glycosyltransferase
MPKISIGIPTLNGPARLERCLRSIKQHTPLLKYDAEVLVSDDYSYDKNFKENKTICHTYRVPMLTTEDRLGVSQQWNRLVRHTDAPIQILLNDDVEVVPHWLEALVYSLEQNPHAGVVGLKAYQGVTTINFTPPIVPSYMEAVMERGSGLLAAQGFCFGFLKSKWTELEGFDPQFFAFYEEIDFGIRLFEKNWPSYMLSYPIILHQGGATTSDSGNIDASAVLLESREKFKRKHPAISEIRAHMDAVVANHIWPPVKQWNTGLLVTQD